MRELSCYCVPCIHGQFSECDNKSYVAPFKDVVFASDVHVANRDTDGNGGTVLHSEAPVEDFTPTEHNDSLQSIICSDTIIAIIALMPSVQSLEDYYLIHVTSAGVVTSEEDQYCDFGHTFLKGSDVIIGQLYKHQRSTKVGCTYKRDNKAGLEIHQFLREST